MQRRDDQKHQKDTEQQCPMQVFQKFSHTDYPYESCGPAAPARSFSQAKPEINSLKVQSILKSQTHGFGVWY
jgi:hypothetical protein